MLKLTVFADLHYKKRMYSTSVEHLRTVFDRAHAHGAQAVICLGDFCNDFCGSPEIVNEFLNNSYGLPVYNVYGNHELETMGNTMARVTPLLTNQEVNWGHGITDGSVGYYYFDLEGYRFVALDTNYSYNPDTEEWEHNREGSWGYPGSAGLEGHNINGNALSPRQMEWLRDTLDGAADKGLRCIMLSHAPLTAQMSARAYESREIEKLIDDINKKKRGTVIMCVNGHRHTDAFLVRNGVVYLDVNTVINGAWREKTTPHYKSGQGFEFVDYDREGNEISRYRMDHNDLRQGLNTWVFTSPLSANITIDGDMLTVEGSEAEWAFGVLPDLGALPEDNASRTVPRISSHKYIFCD